MEVCFSRREEGLPSYKTCKEFEVPVNNEVLRN